jgi:molybdate transport system substrate-binding protein
MPSRRVALAGLTAAMLAACAPASEGPASSEAPVRVFAAASLIDVLRVIGKHYEAAGHSAPVLNFAASSELARQIEQGADADIFISADEAWMDHLADRDLIDESSRKSLLSNSLVLIAPADRPISVEIAPGMNLAGALRGGKLAIANPDSVPAGRYAKQALEHFGAWATVEPSSVRAENVRSALRFVEIGEAAAGIVYATDAVAAGAAVTVVGRFPPDNHTPITYPMAVVAGAQEAAARDFLEFLQSDEAKSAFESAGFGFR